MADKLIGKQKEMVNGLANIQQRVEQKGYGEGDDLDLRVIWEDLQELVFSVELADDDEWDELEEIK